MIARGTQGAKRLAEAMWVELQPMIEELVRQEVERRAVAQDKPKRGRPRRLKDQVVEKSK